MHSWIRKISFGFLISILSIVIVIAQDAACPEFVRTALESVENSCSALGRNEVCYGYNDVQASFTNAVPEDYFTHISDMAPIADLATLRSLPMKIENEEWGVAVMNLQANVPNSLIGQNVTFVLIGDVEVENAVSSEDAFVPSDGIEITIAVTSANLRSGAGTNFNVIDGLYRGETVIADGISEDGEWLRVVKDNRPLWLNRSLVAENPEIESLPVLTDDLRTPMQAFYLRTGIGQPACLEAPDNILLVQGPENIEIDLTVNGANVRLGSSGAFRVSEVDGESFLEVLVFDGKFEIDGTEIHTGQRSVLCLGDSASRGMDGETNDLVVTCEPSSPEPIENFGADWCNMESIPRDILNYQIEVLCPGETAPANSSNSGTASVSQIRQVDCSNFRILTGDIPATNFVFSWTEATGADSYEVAVYDNSGFQVSSTTTSGTSLTMNGGTSFPSAGYIDLRAYQAGVYACYTRLNFSRSADPNQVLTSGIAITFDSGCNPNYVGAANMYFTVTWSNVTPPIDITWSDGFNSDSHSFATSSGSYTGEYGPAMPNTVTATASDGNSVTRICNAW